MCFALAHCTAPPAEQWDTREWVGGAGAEKFPRALGKLSPESSPVCPLIALSHANPYRVSVVIIAWRQKPTTTTTTSTA